MFEVAALLLVQRPLLAQQLLVHVPCLLLVATHALLGQLGAFVLKLDKELALKSRQLGPQFGRLRCYVLQRGSVASKGRPRLG